ncbi:Tachykinin-like peptides receptor 86C [Trichoplax sp. H2]|uniref:G-protein coupled receptors family 1 profile domain-containing protein n=1 Tax=Trichoplax adhaerens TaxID=10228 RepID=B3RZV0_TRIAD|nr:hypothetical protein TRIADDRAFT_57587 [Trichoplax adhaerens]EDV24267.1 hypothetical protein TRIADDRAFT_57587 [Trichoplax adhaerens]RDD44017.1 Tachykinin-like peptides receptor 86C [Trichoplax sp. H2]|eukprot:XP_002113793.1 hypothetical protein TRIADDRAFT_57587 [Trichoplax adhaerens]
MEIQAAASALTNSTNPIQLQQIQQSYGLFAIITMICGIIGIIFQTWTIVTVWYIKRMHVASFILIANLAVADLLYSLSLLFFGILQFIYIKISLPILVMSVNCHISFFLIGTNYGTSIVTLTFISYDRYKRIITPLSNERSHNRRIKYYIILSWLLGTIVGVLISVTTIVDPYFPFTCDLSYKLGLVSVQVIYTMIIIIFYLLPIIVILIFYCQVISKLKNMTRPGVSTQEQRRAYKEMRKSAIRLIIGITVIFILATWPYWATTLGLIYTGANFMSLRASGKIFEGTIAGFSTVPIMLTAFINPIVYLIFNKSLRQDMIATCCRRQHQDAMHLSMSNLENSNFIHTNHISINITKAVNEKSFDKGYNYLTYNKQH